MNRSKNMIFLVIIVLLMSLVAPPVDSVALDDDLIEELQEPYESEGCDALEDYEARVSVAVLTAFAELDYSEREIERLFSTDMLAFSDSQWGMLEDISGAVVESMEEMNVPDQVEDWHDAFIEAMSILENLAGDVPDQGIFLASLVYLDAIEQSEAKMESAERSLLRDCPDIDEDFFDIFD